MSERIIVVCKNASLGEKETAKFRLGSGKNVREGFVIRYGGELHAYRNECRHIPVTMDWVENKFLSRDGCWLQCATHGALYAIDTGLCVSGPPSGETLERLTVEIRGEDIVVLAPVP